MTCCQPVASAKAPWTRTMTGLVSSFADLGASGSFAKAVATEATDKAKAKAKCKLFIIESFLVAGLAGRCTQEGVSARSLYQPIVVPSFSFNRKIVPSPRTCRQEAVLFYLPWCNYSGLACSCNFLPVWIVKQIL